MITIATLAALLTMDTSGFTQGAEKAGGVTDKLKGNMESFGKAGLVAFGGAATAAGGLIGYGVKIAADMEQAKVGFTTMLGSAEKAESFIKDLQAFAASTPFEFAGLQQSASKLIAVGVEANRVIPLMTVLGDATSAVGTGAEGIDRAVMALTQMQQKGKVTGEEMLQLVEAGIPAWDALASKMGVDVATAQDMVSKGQVKVNDLFGALEGRAGPALQRVNGMMEEQSKTFTGMLSNLKDTFDQQLGAMAGPVMEALKGVLPSITKLVETTIKAVTPILAEGAAGIGRFVDAFKNGAEGMRTSGFVGLMQDLGGRARTAFQWVIENKDFVIGAVVAIGAVWAASMALAAVETIAATWPLLALIAVLAAYVGLGIRLWNLYGETIKAKVDEIRPKLESFYNEVIVPFGTFMTEKFVMAWDWLKQKWDELQPSLQVLKDAMLIFYEVALKPVFQFIADNQEMVRNLAILFGLVAAAVILLQVVIAVAMIVAFVAMIAVIGAVILVLGLLLIALARIVNVVWDVFNNVRDAFGGVIEQIEQVTQIFWDLAQNVGSAIADVIRWVWGVATAVEGMANTVSRKVSEVIAWFDGLPGRIAGAVGDLGSLLWNAGASMMEGLKNGFMSKVESVKSSISNALGAIRRLFPGSPAKEGPFSGRGWVSYSGEAISRDFARGISSGQTKVMDATKGLVVAARHQFDLADAAAEMLAAVRSGASFFEDFSFVGQSAAFTAGNWSEKLADLFYAGNPGFDFGRAGTRTAATGFLESVGHGSGNAGGVRVDFAGDTSSAFAAAFMQLVRTGQIQLTAT